MERGLSHVLILLFILVKIICQYIVYKYQYYNVNSIGARFENTLPVGLTVSKHWFLAVNLLSCVHDYNSTLHSK